MCVCYSQDELRPEDLVSTRIMKKNKAKVVCGNVRMGEVTIC